MASMFSLKSIHNFVNFELQASIQNRTSYLFISSLFSYIAKNYPSEILEGRLYLGDQFHAADVQILNHLRVTHILNVTNLIPNHFESSSKIYIYIYQVI
jgi:hypothetical protein